MADERTFDHGGGVIPSVYNTYTTGTVYSASKLKAKSLTVEESFLAGFNGEDFSKKCLVLTASTGGSVLSSPQKEVFNEGAVARLTASPDPGYEFDSWIGEGVLTPTEPVITVEMSADRYISGSFKRK